MLKATGAVYWREASRRRSRYDIIYTVESGAETGRMITVKAPG